MLHWPEGYIALNKNAFLKILEHKYLYNKSTDELYELNDEAFEFLRFLDGTKTLDALFCRFKLDRDFIDFLIRERLVDKFPNPSPAKNNVAIFPLRDIPSLRYLHLLVTRRCNLSCKHCFLGQARAEDMNISLFKMIIEDFASIGGLRLLVSGGEPTMHPEFFNLNSLLAEQPFRTILITNGVTLSAEHPQKIEKLNFEEIQISLDGLEDSHDKLRGKGSFEKTIKAAEKVKMAGKSLSIATIITAYNRNEFPQLKTIVSTLGADSWSVDFPCPEGRASSSGMMPDIEDSSLTSYGFGSEVHESFDKHICGAHLATIDPYGYLLKCDYYPDWTGGSVEKGLLEAWKRLPRIGVSDLKCDCSYIYECRGGCRYRGELYNKSRLAPDPVQCHNYGVSKKLTDSPEGRESYAD